MKITALLKFMQTCNISDLNILNSIISRNEFSIVLDINIFILYCLHFFN